MDKKLIVIVGGGPGVSSSVARIFGSKGFKVILVARNEQALAELVRNLEAQGVEAYGATANAADPAALQTAFEQIKRNHGIPEALVYNAAVIKLGTASSLTEAELLDDLNVNVVGALSSALQVIPDFIERRSGTILFTGGGFALTPSYELASLSIGKAALRSLVYTLGEELAPHGIHVGTITIAGTVAVNTKFAPDRIAQAYWDMYEKQNEREIIYQ
ncbi:SDR family NAD(P)-dependent oxidoreductase [Paenibacillus sp. FSL R5-0527]|uniref:SDR family NAD(P)-dependent oxidoreductase n=1 Tax=Paenibacillus TaxID=44249 RepID=UPI00097A141C|nr:SDR family NAD(P)-dependent oxidoreductase [Paenibacillus macerans]OMG46292.1 short-chain dehydrogenase [Paenibacillus macerans]